MTESSLNEIRMEFDSIDEALLELLNRRAALALRIGEFKKNRGLGVHDQTREQAVLEALFNRNRGPLEQRDIAEIYQAVFSVSRRLQGEK